MHLIKKLYVIWAFILSASPLGAQTLLPKGLILYDKPGATVVVVDKTECSVSIFHNQSSWEKIQQYECATGRKLGDKQFEGDLKTPTGLYFFTDAWTGQELVHSYGSAGKIYGAGAFELNYPNYLDKIHYKKNGSGIWLHGTDQNFPSATRGCISTTNIDFLNVAQFITLYQTPIIIEESIDYVSPDEIHQLKSDLLRFIQQWREAWEQENTKKYLSFYSKKFKTGKFNYHQWKRFKRQINKQNQNRQIKIKDISILKAKGVFHIQFIQHYSSFKTNDLGIKRLYVAKEKGSFRIISETWRPLKSPSISPQYVFEDNNIPEALGKFKKETL